MKILGFIPARGGSKTIPLKNLHKIFNKPLIQYTIESALQSKIFYKILVSSDNKKILNCTKKFKKILYLKRPKSISGDTASTDSALEHALIQLNKNKDLIFHDPSGYLQLPFREELSLIPLVEKTIMKYSTKRRKKLQKEVARQIFLNMNDLSKQNNSQFLVLNLQSNINEYEEFFKKNDINFVDCNLFLNENYLISL